MGDERAVAVERLIEILELIGPIADAVPAARYGVEILPGGADRAALVRRADVLVQPRPARPPAIRIELAGRDDLLRRGVAAPAELHLRVEGIVVIIQADGVRL